MPHRPLAVLIRVGIRKNKHRLYPLNSLCFLYAKDIKNDRIIRKEA